MPSKKTAESSDDKPYRCAATVKSTKNGLHRCQQKADESGLCSRWHQDKADTVDASILKAEPEDVAPCFSHLLK